MLIALKMHALCILHFKPNSKRLQVPVTPEKATADYGRTKFFIISPGAATGRKYLLDPPSGAAMDLLLQIDHRQTHVRRVGRRVVNGHNRSR
jgi:hypothetical protein